MKKAILVILAMFIAYPANSHSKEEVEKKINTMYNHYKKDYCLIDSEEDIGTISFFDTGYKWKVRKTLKFKKLKKNRYGSLSYQRICFSYYHFDSEQLKERFSNWLKYHRLSVGQDKVNRSSKTPAFFLLINKDYIITVWSYADSFGEYAPHYKSFIKRLRKEFETDESIIADIGLGGPIKWIQF